MGNRSLVVIIKIKYNIINPLDRWTDLPVILFSQNILNIDMISVVGDDDQLDVIDVRHFNETCQSTQLNNKQMMRCY